jgi:hypothetical protein
MEQELHQKEEQQAATTTITPLFGGASAESDADDEVDGKATIVSFASGFRDKVRTLFEYFDRDQDGYLNFQELKALQDATSAHVDNEEDEEDDDDDNDDENSKSSSPPVSSLTEDMYVMACKTLDCHPSKGLSVEALKFTYAADGADIDKDFNLVFTEDGHPKQRRLLQKGTTRTRSSTRSNGMTSTNPRDCSESLEIIDRMINGNGEEKIYEVGADGTVDISS